MNRMKLCAWCAEGLKMAMDLQEQPKTKENYKPAKCDACGASKMTSEYIKISRGNKNE